ncbi:MAG: zinc/manganese transport system permease protein [Chloroflexota bacterium]|jgi:zinc/manganese transport system permease protein|nr:zinc/manganese transport system permease protein [Chloroflexota bacterium]
MLELSLAAAPYFGWDLLRVVQELFRYAFMQHAFEAGTIVALSAGVIGYFVVLRGLSFAAHALSHIGFAGATGAVLIGTAPIVGLLVFTMSAGAVMGALGQRLRGRDVTIGLVMAWSLGLGLLFTRLYKGSANLAIGILFGQIFGITSQDVAVTFVAGLVTVLLVVAVYRPLLFATLDEEVAEAKGVPVRGLSIAFMVVLAVAVSEAVQVVGVLLIFALIVAPAAVAERFTTRPSRGVLLAAILAVLFTWAGLTIAYYLPYPVGFFITTIAFWTYLVARVLSDVIARRATGRVRPWREEQVRHSP